MKGAYPTLLTVSPDLLEQAQQAKDTLPGVGQPAAQRLADQLTTVIPRVQQVIRQTQRRVLHGERVPARDKLVRLVEPHTALFAETNWARTSRLAGSSGSRKSKAAS